MASRLQDFFRNDPLAYVEYLDRLSYDELIEIDLRANTCANLEHVAGKYFVPILSGGYDDVFRCTVNMVHPDDWARYEAAAAPDQMAAFLARCDPPDCASLEIRYRLISGGWSWTKLIIIFGPRFGLPKNVARFYIFDINNRKNRAIGQMAAVGNLEEPRDGRTRLLRERPFFAHAQKRIDAGLEGWCLLVLDIDHFRLFNDWYGRSAGDMLLAEIGAVLLRHEERFDALAGYLGQDNFCLLTPFVRRNIGELAEELRDLIAAHGTATGFFPSLGLRPFEGKPQIMDLLDDAIIALKEVKRNYRARICVFRPEMRDRSEDSYRMLLDFQNAIDNGEIVFFLQPQCRISNRRIVGAECLARWRRADGTMVSPADFIPVLEQYGFITDLDTYIWEQVCIWLRRWMDSGRRPIPISLNVSPMDIFHISVPERFAELADKYGIPRGVLKAEITESAYASDEEHVGKTVAELQRLCFPVLMDDFGTGYSSLNMLRDINVDVIKLDARFLQLSGPDNAKGIRIIESVLNMTQNMAIPVIVEGVETAEQTSYLADLGCRYIQGFHFYRPMPVKDFEALAADDANIDRSGIVFKANAELHVREFLDENIYSDAMLNNILGAVAFYSCAGDNVDIIRFNERFYQLVSIPDFHERLNAIQRFIYPNDLPDFYALFERAHADRLNGADGVVGVYRSDGSLGLFLLRVYFLEETERGRQYYGSMQEITESTRLQRQMHLLSEYSGDSVVFLRSHGGKTSFQVAIHGLRDVLGLDREAFEAELNSGAFMHRIPASDREQLRELSLSFAAERKTSCLSFRLENTRGETVTLYMKTDYVNDEYSGVDYVVTIRQREEF